jgi:class 3 adenylate cyclase
MLLDHRHPCPRAHLVEDMLDILVVAPGDEGGLLLSYGGWCRLEEYDFLAQPWRAARGVQAWARPVCKTEEAILISSSTIDAIRDAKGQVFARFVGPYAATGDGSPVHRARRHG